MTDDDHDLAEENRILRLGNALLRTALKATTDELAAVIERQYRHTKNHPTMFRRYERDMTAVIMARAVLNEARPMPTEN